MLRNCLRILFAGSIALSPFAAQAAPDNTLGMALMSASVSSNGTVAASSGVTSVGSVRTGTGQYLISFDRDLAACTCTASFGERNFALISHQSAISASCPYTAQTVFVYTSVNDALTDRGFQLIVFCPK